MEPALPPDMPFFDESDGWPRPRWAALWDWVEQSVAAGDRQEAACALERTWLDRLARHLGGGYAVSESDDFLLLVDHAAADPLALLEIAEATLRLVDDSLEQPGDASEIGKIPVLVFSEDDDFYDYLAPQFPAGHYGRFAGVCVRDGDVHLAIRSPEIEMRRTLAHELAHARLTHLNLPLWLEEGVVEVVTRRVCDDDPFHLDPIQRDRHYAAWSWHGLQYFWSGAAFGRPDELQWLSYELAECVVRRMHGKDPAAFGELLKCAELLDSGEAACRRLLNQSLTAFVADLLGEGPWLPPATPPGV